MPSRDEIAALCDSYVSAVSAHDLDAVLAQFAPDATQEEPAGSAPNVGADAIRAFFASTLDVAFEMVRFGPVNVVGNRAVFQALVIVQSQSGPVSMTTTDVLTVDDACRISELVAFPDRDAAPTDAPGARRALSESARG